MSKESQANPSWFFSLSHICIVFKIGSIPVDILSTQIAIWTRPGWGAKGLPKWPSREGLQQCTGRRLGPGWSAKDFCQWEAGQWGRKRTWCRSWSGGRELTSRADHVLGRATARTRKESRTRVPGGQDQLLWASIYQSFLLLLLYSANWPNLRG